MSLKPEQNELLTRVEESAPMGRYLRETAWFPAILASKLVADDAPTPVRLLGEDFVAFRSTDGRVGFFSEYCPHRRASLLLARNEDNALRCIFHGWKFSVDGRTVEAPTQPMEHDAFCAKVPLEHYPVREAAGIVWVWLGKAEPAPFPAFEWTGLSGDQVYPVYQVARFNWIQAVEGLVDSAHVAVLHQDWLKKNPNNPNLARAAFDTAPIYEFEDRPRGFRYASLRSNPDATNYVRVTEFVAPWFCFIPSDQGHCIFTVPIDDENTAFWIVRYDPDGPLIESAYNPAPDPGDWPPQLPGTKANRWGQDREAMKRGSFTGFSTHLLHEDFAVAASQGRIADRSKEFLNSGDQAVVRTRSYLLRALKQFEAGGEPAETSAQPQVTYRAGSMVIPTSADWRNERLVLTPSRASAA